MKGRVCLTTGRPGPDRTPLTPARLQSLYQVPVLVAVRLRAEVYQIDWRAVLDASPARADPRILVAGARHYTLPGCLCWRIGQANAEQPLLFLDITGLLVGAGGCIHLGPLAGLSPRNALATFEWHLSRNSQELRWSPWERMVE